MGGTSKAEESNEGREPRKSDIFSSGKAGKSIRIGCWIGRSVTVPSL